MNAELKTCPFCGGAELVGRTQMASSAYIECVSCGGCGPKFGTDVFIVNRQPAKTALDRQEKACIEKAEKLWNRRESQDAALAQDRASQGASSDSMAMRARFDEIEQRIARNDMSAAEVFTQMRTAAIYLRDKASQAGAAVPEAIMQKLLAAQRTPNDRGRQYLLDEAISMLAAPTPAADREVRNG